MHNYLELFEKIETCQDWYDFLDNPEYDSIDFGYAISHKFWNPVYLHTLTWVILVEIGSGRN